MIENLPNKFLEQCAIIVSFLLSKFLRFLIFAYRYSFAYFLGGQCRFTPSCSAYALEAIESHGPFEGAKLAAGRFCRCHPWGGHGVDPVPKNQHNQG